MIISLFVNWFYEKFVDNLKNYHSPDIIRRQHDDQACLIYLIEKYNCESVLEIGTWEGQTALLLWLHPQIKKLKAIDIHNKVDIETNCELHTPQEKEFIGHYLKNTKASIDFIDTMKWNPIEWKKKAGHFDLIFIDANHDVEHVRNDTLKALELKPKVIVWHDVNHCEGGDFVPMFLNEFRKTHPQHKLEVFSGTEIGYIILEENGKNK